MYASALSAALAAMQAAILAAITAGTNTLLALFFQRVADAGNSSVTALTPAGTFTGVWKSTRGEARVDIALTNAATLNLIVEHTDDTGAGAEAALTETWPAIAATHPTFPTPLPRLFYRVRLVDTGGGGAVTLAATLDPRAVGAYAPIGADVAVNVLAAGTTNVIIPPGAGGFVFQGYIGGGLPNPRTLWGHVAVYAFAAGVQRQTYMYAGGGIGSRSELNRPTPPLDTLRFASVAGAGLVLTLTFLSRA